MNAHDALMSRRTVHEFRPEVLPEGVLERALECALRAPNHKLTNPWRFIRVGRVARKAFVDVAAERKFGEGYSEKQREMLGRKMETSPEFVVVTQVIAGDAHRRREDYAAVACAIQNMCVALWADGVASKWSTTGAIEDARVYDLLGVDPAVEEIVGVVFAGFAEVVPQTPRRPLHEVLRSVE